MRPSWSAARCIACAALAAAPGCAGGGGARDGGDAGAGRDGAEPEAAVEAGGEAALDAFALDAASPDAACPTRLPLASWPGAPWDGGWEFTGAQQLDAYFDQLAQSARLIIPAHQVDCTQAGVSLGECTYDPLQPARDTSDLHYSDAQDRFIGPDGYDYVWVHVKQGDLYVVALLEGSPASYGIILDYVRCHGSEA